MIKVVLRRLLQTAVTLALLVTITFFMLHHLPGSPFDTDTALAPEVKAHLEARYHLDRPLIEQYWIYLKSFGVGDLGTSYQYLDQGVGEMIAETLPNTLSLGLFSLLFSYALGVPLGLIAARYHNSKRDVFTMLFAASGVSLPAFLVAPLLILVFSFWLDWLPPALWQGPKYYVLPVITLALRPAAIIARLVRASALDVIHADYVRTATAKGLTNRQILFKHVFKNSLIPLFGVSGTIVANILSGSFVVELMFAIPGLSHHFVESVSSRDYPLILALTLLYGIILSVANLVLDLLSMLADPRMQVN